VKYIRMYSWCSNAAQNTDHIPIHPCIHQLWLFSGT